MWPYRAKSQKLFDLHELKKEQLVHAVLTLNNKRTKIRERERERERDKKKKKKGGVVKTKQKG